MHKLLYIMGVLALVVSACAKTTAEKPRPQFVVTGAALTLTTDTGAHQKCTGLTDPNCSAQGPNHVSLLCQLDTHECSAVQDIDKCEGSPDPTVAMQCGWEPCNAGDPCDDSDANTVDSCQPTEVPVANGYGGVCLHLNKLCTAYEGTACSAPGQIICSGGQCPCVSDDPKHGASAELCNGKDDNCDGQTDEGFNVGQPCDGDDSDQCKNGTYTCTANGLGVECANETVKDIKEVCDGKDNDCNGVTDDPWPTLGDKCDGDDADSCKNGTFACNATQDDVVCVNDKSVTEICNGADDTCDGTTDEGCDDDGDLYCDSSMKVAKGATCSKSTIPSDSSTIAGDDCNDADKTINPGAEEICDGVDNNCSGKTDEDFAIGDDCHSDDGLTSQGVCQTPGTKQCMADGTLGCSAKEDTTQQATEICDGLDNDCDGLTDEGCDDDGDLYCDSSMKVAKGATCSKSTIPSDSSTIAGDDCNDKDKNINPGATEICDGADNDCSGATDEKCDQDSDGYCNAAMIVASGATCKLGAGGVGDCNDLDPAINPGAAEICNTKDDNCDGKIDNAADGSSVCPTMCQNAKTVKCGATTKLDMTSNEFAATEDMADTYTCHTIGSNTYKYTPFKADDLYVVLDCPGVSSVNVQVKAPGGETGRVFVTSDCSPSSGAYSADQCAKSAVFYTSNSKAMTATLSGLDPTKVVLVFDSATNISDIEVTPNAAP